MNDAEALAEEVDVEVPSGKGRTDENFPVGVLVGRRLRRHVHAFYDFARNADDIADHAVLDPDDKVWRLDVMEAVLTGHAGTGSPSAIRLRASLQETGVTGRHSRDLLVAFRRDARNARCRNWDDLHDYCRYSAMPVGRHVLDLHGEDRATWAASDALCTSLQVLNHLQDCAVDLARMDRLYLPLDWLEENGASATDLARLAATPGMRRVFDALLAKCEELNRAARALPRGVKDRRLRLETAVIVGLAHRLAARLRRGDPIARRVRLTKTDAAFSVLGALRVLP
jgi:farnesyl-diphosphate farnesyltransferase